MLSCSLAISGCPYFLFCGYKGWSSSLCILCVIHNFVHLVTPCSWYYVHRETPLSPGGRNLVHSVTACREKLFNSSTQSITFSATLPVLSDPTGDRVTRAACSIWNTGTSQVRARKAFSFLFRSFSGNTFLFDEVAFLQASGLHASMMWDDLMFSVLFF